MEINFSFHECNIKIVYYGPGLSGKTTNLQVIHKTVSEGKRGKLTALATDLDRTLFFDYMPIDLGKISGMNLRLRLFTVPGQVYYNAIRKLVLRCVDGVVFVADSQESQKNANDESLQSLKENLAEIGLDIKTIPLVLQYNKRDLPNIMSLEQMDADLNRDLGATAFPAVAVTGENVELCLKTIASKTIQRAEMSMPSRSVAPNRPAAPPPPNPPAANRTGAIPNIGVPTNIPPSINISSIPNPHKPGTVRIPPPPQPNPPPIMNQDKSITPPTISIQQANMPHNLQQLQGVQTPTIQPQPNTQASGTQPIKLTNLPPSRLVTPLAMSMPASGMQIQPPGGSAIHSPGMQPPNFAGMQPPKTPIMNQEKLVTPLPTNIPPAGMQLQFPPGAQQPKPAGMPPKPAGMPPPNLANIQPPKPSGSSIPNVPGLQAPKPSNIPPMQQPPNIPPMQQPPPVYSPQHNVVNNELSFSQGFGSGHDGQLSPQHSLDPNRAERIKSSLFRGNLSRSDSKTALSIPTASPTMIKPNLGQPGDGSADNVGGAGKTTKGIKKI